MDRGTARRKAHGMGLFRRKANIEVEPNRCPLCNERVPDGAEECAMCGADLKVLRPWSEERQGTTPRRIA